MAELKTKPTEENVDEFVEAIPHAQKRADSKVLLAMMREATQLEPQMWGNMVGFGRYTYQYASGHKGEWFGMGFAPRKQALTLYLMGGQQDYEELLAKLGKHKTGVGCLYINKLADVDTAVLRQLIAQSAAALSQP
jgi:hypothetical protein